MSLKTFWNNIDIPNVKIKQTLLNNINYPNILQIIIKHIVKNHKELINICWEWLKYCGNDGYGRCTHQGIRSVRVSRICWEISRKRKIGNLIIRHTCDNPKCVNPFHLRKGTIKQNSQDMVERNRSLSGEKHSLTNFTNKDVQQILIDLQNNILLKDIAFRYKVTETTIYQIAYGLTWSFLYNELTEEQKITIKNNLQKNQLRNKITEDDVRQIRLLWNTNRYTKTQLAKMFNLNGVTTIANIINRKSWSNVI